MFTYWFYAYIMTVTLINQLDKKNHKKNNMTIELKGEVLSRIVISDKQLQYIQRKLTYTQFNKLIW